MPNIALEALRSLLSGRRAPNVPASDPSLPDLPPTPIFTDPPVLGGGQVAAQHVRKLMNLAPTLRGLVKSIQVGPSEDVLGYLVESNKRFGTNYSIQDFGDLNLRGLTNTKTGKITLNPNMDPLEQEEILAHELAHIGAKYGKVESIADLAQKYVQESRKAK